MVTVIIKMPYELRLHSLRSDVYRLHKQVSIRPTPPGMLSYKYNADELRQIDTSTTVTGDGEIWVNEPISDTIKLCLLPYTQKTSQWKLAFVMKRVTENNDIWLKGALVNIITGKVALITAASSENMILQNGNRAIKSHDNTYYVGQYAMLAPLAFWKNIKEHL